MSALAGVAGLIAIRSPLIGLFQRNVIADSRSTALGFEPIQTGSEWDLHWNSGTPALRAAQTGLLTIVDGERIKTLELDRSELGSGRVLYRPETRDVSFRLQVYTSNGHVFSESVSAKTNPVAVPIPSKPVVATPVPAPVALQAAIPSTPEPLKRPQTESAPLPKAVPPQIAKAQPAAPVANLPPPPKRIVRPPSATLTDDSFEEAYIAPRPLQKPIPDLTLFGSANYSLRAVAVRVSVDASGRVVNARLANAGLDAGSVLDNAAVSAAREWTFLPARLHGRPVPSDYTILFRFTPRSP